MLFQNPNHLFRAVLLCNHFVAFASSQNPGTSVSFTQCKARMESFDANSDNWLDRAEYVTFVSWLGNNTFENNTFQQEAFSELPMILQDNFNTLATGNGIDIGSAGDNIFGSRAPRQNTSDVEQMFLERVCNETSYAIAAALSDVVGPQSRTAAPTSTSNNSSTGIAPFPTTSPGGQNVSAPSTSLFNETSAPSSSPTASSSPSTKNVTSSPTGGALPLNGTHAPTTIIPNIINGSSLAPSATGSLAPNSNTGIKTLNPEYASSLAPTPLTGIPSSSPAPSPSTTYYGTLTPTATYTNSSALTVNSSFILSNSLGIRDASIYRDVINSAYQMFVEGVVAEIVGIRNVSALEGKRRLTVTLYPESPLVRLYMESRCPSTASANALCHTFFGSYRLLLESENAGVANSTYVNATQQAIGLGLLQQSFDAVDSGLIFTVMGPSTPVFYIPPEMVNVTLAPSLSPAPTLSPAPSMKPSWEPTLYPTISEQPTRAPIRATPSPSEEAETDGRVFIYIMVIAAICALCCGYNRGYGEVEKYQDGETAVKEFREEMMKKKFCFIDITQGAISGWCLFKSIPFCKAKAPIPRERFTRALFYTTRIKRRWKPQLTYLQFLFGWISLFSTIVAVKFPENKSNLAVGFAALFLSDLILHLWYGFLRYPNLAWTGLADAGEGDGLFEEIKDIFSVLYHDGDTEDKFDPWVDWICQPFILVLHIATLFGFLVATIACAILKDNDGRPDKFSALVGALLGSFAYPLFFALSPYPEYKVLATFMHHVVHEYYEAKLFRKAGKEFLLGVFLKFLYDYGEIDFTMDDEFEILQALYEDHPDPDGKKVDEEKGK